MYAVRNSLLAGLLATSALALSPMQPQQVGNVHGEGSCFLPLKQLDQDYYAPRIIQVRAYKLTHCFCFTDSFLTI